MYVCARGGTLCSSIRPPPVSIVVIVDPYHDMCSSIRSPLCSSIRPPPVSVVVVVDTYRDIIDIPSGSAFVHVRVVVVVVFVLLLGAR